jgi:DNA-binding NarL/FixJ family response regulator
MQAMREFFNSNIMCREHKSRILVIDDDRMSRYLIGALLDDEGFFGCHTILQSGEEALSLLGQEFDLIITDINMGKISGIQIACAFRTAGSKARIVAITSMPRSYYMPTTFDIFDLVISKSDITDNIKTMLRGLD